MGEDNFLHGEKINVYPLSQLYPLSEHGDTGGHTLHGGEAEGKTYPSLMSKSHYFLSVLMILTNKVYRTFAISVLYP